MPNIWLYPISEDSGYHFAAKGKKWPTSPAGFASMVRDGAGADDRWTVHANRKSVQVGDQIIVYASKKGARPPLIIGVGQVTKPPEWYPSWERHTVRIRWHRQRCLDLAVSPIDGTHLMLHLPAQKAAVVRLPPELQEWVLSRLHIRKGMAQRLSGYVAGTDAEVKKILVKHGLHHALLRHDARLIFPFRSRLVKAGWDILRTRPTNVEIEADLLASRGGQSLIVEAKTTTQPGDGRHEIRYAIGQLLDYQHFLLPRILPKGMKRTRTHRLILLEHSPHPELASFAEKHRFLIAWFAKHTLNAGPKSSEVLRSLLS